MIINKLPDPSTDKIIDMDFALLYPNVVQHYNIEFLNELQRLLRIRDRNKKLNRILNNINER